MDRRQRTSAALGGALVASALAGCIVIEDTHRHRERAEMRHVEPSEARPPAAPEDPWHAEQIERLELGLSALAELGYETEHAHLARVLDEVRGGREVARDQPRDAPRDEDAERREVRRRIAVMRGAVETFLEAGRPDAADSVERAMHARELALAGRRDPEAMAIREAAPDRGQLAELLAWAADLAHVQGREERTAALAELSGVYAEQWRRRQPAERAGAERRAVELGELRTRLEILRHARAAHAEANQRAAAEVLERAIHVGELQLEGADEGRVERAFEGLSIGMLIELLQDASGLYHEWGHPDRADLCAALAEYYARREREGG